MTMLASFSFRILSVVTGAMLLQGCVGHDRPPPYQGYTGYYDEPARRAHGAPDRRKQDGDVRVMQRVDDRAALPLTDDEVEMSKDAKLVRDGRRFHLDGLGQLVDGAGTVA